VWSHPASLLLNQAVFHPCFHRVSRDLFPVRSLLTSHHYRQCQSMHRMSLHHPPCHLKNHRQPLLFHWLYLLPLAAPTRNPTWAPTQNPTQLPTTFDCHNFDNTSKSVHVGQGCNWSSKNSQCTVTKQMGMRRRRT
jgi:hypothetical protein